MPDIIYLESLNILKMGARNKDSKLTPCSTPSLSQVLFDKKESEMTLTDFLQSGEINLSQDQLNSLINF